MSRRRGRAFVAWLAVTALAASLLVAGGFWVANYLRDAFAPPLAIGCTATVDGKSYSLAVDQTESASLISALSVRRGMPARAASIALATALQESKLRNIDYGDLDSVGLFQQRPSQDWGTAAQIMDPVYSATAFYNALEKVSGYVDMPLNDAAQIVQRSASPHAYAQHEDLSRAFASALTGHSQGALSCTLPPATAGGTPTAVEQALNAVFGPVAAAPAADGGPSSLLLEVTDRTGWAVAQWAVANAHQLGITQVGYNGRQWTRGDTNQKTGTNAGWQPAAAGPAGTVQVTLATAPSVTP
ncbi:hypothetical protein [Arthrobacter wenxiniae]|uniref:Heavy metal transporter n=1 Tax=Arthrobacter wenxiniae TaxID=2713570 RepID=A0A7Y7IK91_9MICC|nr:hypothetical protein [Arthrobacter wenxiniae]